MPPTEIELNLLAKGRIKLGIDHLNRSIKALQSTAKGLLKLKIITETQGYDNVIKIMLATIKYLASQKGLTDIKTIVRKEIVDNETKWN